MEFSARINIALWLLCLGYLGLYVFGFVMGAFSPAELIGFTALAVVLATAFGVHAFRVQRAMRDRGNASHRHLMAQTHRYREQRGF